MTIITNSPTHFFLNFMPQESQVAFLSFSLQGKRADPPVVLSTFPQSVRNVLYILPEDPLEAVMQLPTLAALQTFFEESQASIFCQHTVADLFEGSPHIPKALAYSSRGTLLFSKTARYWARFFRECDFDASFLLDRSNGIRRSFICANARIPLRVAHASPDTGMFCNLTVRRQNTSAFVADQNISLVRSLGFNCSADSFRWTVTPQAQKVANHVLRELGLPVSEDVVAVSTNLGPTLVKNLVGRILRQGKQVLLVPGPEATSKNDWEDDLENGFFACPPLPFVEAAAILHTCSAFVSAKGPLLYVAHYAGIRCLAILASHDMREWKPRSPNFRAIEDTPDRDLICQKILSQIFQSAEPVPG